MQPQPTGKGCGYHTVNPRVDGAFFFSIVSIPRSPPSFSKTDSQPLTGLNACVIVFEFCPCRGLCLAEYQHGAEEEGSPTKAGLAAGEPETVSGEGEARDISADAEEQEEEEDAGAAISGGIKSESSPPGEEAGGDGEGGVQGGRRRQQTGASDADFDHLLASYLGGSGRTDYGGEGGEVEGKEGVKQGGDVFGKAGGSLLMPLGALRLLRWAFLFGERGGWIERERETEIDEIHGLECLLVA